MVYTITQLNNFIDNSHNHVVRGLARQLRDMVDKLSGGDAALECQDLNSRIEELEATIERIMALPRYDMEGNQVGVSMECRENGQYVRFDELEALSK